MNNLQRSIIKEIFITALGSISSELIVPNYVRDLYSSKHKVNIIALGKAGSSMLEGALSALTEQFETGLLVTKEKHVSSVIESNSAIKTIIAGHPLPDNNSFYAGNCIIDFVKKLPPNNRLLFLISGGTSSLVESPIDSITNSDIKKIYRWLLSSDLNIDDINSIRKKFSKIKGGGLLNYIQNKNVTALYISDVPNNKFNIIGSGLLNCDYSDKKINVPVWIQDLLKSSHAAKNKPLTQGLTVNSTIIMSNQLLRNKIAKIARLQLLQVNQIDNFITGNTTSEAIRLANWLQQQQPGLYIWGAETTMLLPDNCGSGGRNQSFALMMAKQLHNIDGIIVLAAATDGTDGNTENAGAIIDGNTISKGLQLGLEVDSYLETANAADYLSATGDSLNTGYTGTNVMDIIIAIIWD